MMELQLGREISGEVKILSGRTKGEKVRSKYNLDVADTNDEKVNVIIPPRIWSINTSFFLGCFGKSVRFLGEKKFREKYIFDCDNELHTNIEDGISRALNNGSAI